MVLRFAAASGLALAVALSLTPPARAQFLSFYEMSPRQIVDMLADEGYDLRGPMLRRGDVYVCDVTSVSGRPARLIVDARSGRVIDRYDRAAGRPRYADDDGAPHALRPPRPLADDDDAAPIRNDEAAGHRQMALGDPFSPAPRAHDDDALPPLGDAPAPVKPKHHVAKKHKDATTAKAPDATATPDAAPSVAGVAPTSPEPKSPVADAPKSEAPKSEAPKSEAAPKVVPAPEPRQAKTEEVKPVASEVKPASPAKPEPQRKKLNDLPVGTLD